MEVIRTLIAGMDIGDGLTLAAIIVALGLGVSSLIQSQRLQKRERRERLLNEIIEWATELTKPPSTAIFKDLASATDTTKLSLYVTAHLAQVQQHVRGLYGRNIYIVSIASSFNTDVQFAVGKLIKELYAYIQYLEDWFKRPSDLLANKEIQQDDFDRAGNFTLSIDSLAAEVIKKATKIKTGNIG